MRRIREFISAMAGLGFLIFLAVIFAFIIASIAVWLVDRPPSLPDGDQVLTASRIYYSENITLVGDTYYLNEYYTFERGKWRLKKEILPLGPEFGPVIVKSRQNTEGLK